MLKENEILAQSAAQRGITVSPEELNAEIRRRISDETVDHADKAQAEREFHEVYRSYLNVFQINEDDYRRLVRNTMVRKKFEELIGETVPRVVPQIRVQQLILQPGDDADVMRTRFNDMINPGMKPVEIQEAVRELVREFSRDDEEMVRRGGDLEWIPRGVMLDYDFVLWDLAVGELSEAVPGAAETRQDRYFVVSDKQTARELSSEAREALKKNALQEWINNETPNHDVYVRFGQDVHDWLLAQLRLSEP